MKKTLTLIAASVAVLSLSACNALDMVDVPPVPQAPGPVPSPEVPFVAPQSPYTPTGSEDLFPAGDKVDAPQAPCYCGEQP